jgi:hypothetical protein
MKVYDEKEKENGKKAEMKDIKNGWFVERAYNCMRTNPCREYIEIENIGAKKGIVPTAKFMIQSDPISEVGINGCQIVDILKFVNELFLAVNYRFPCKENVATIEHIQDAINYQNERTKDRIERNVEGKNLN